MDSYLTFLMTCLQSLSRWVRVSVAGVGVSNWSWSRGAGIAQPAAQEMERRQPRRVVVEGGQRENREGGSLKGPRRGWGSSSDVPPLVSPPLTPAFKPPVWAPLELSWKQGGKQDQAKWVGLRKGRREREHSRACRSEAGGSDQLWEGSSRCSTDSIPGSLQVRLTPGRPLPPDSPRAPPGPRIFSQILAPSLLTPGETAVYEEGVYAELRPVMAWKVPGVIASTRHPGLGERGSKVGGSGWNSWEKAPPPPTMGGGRMEGKLGDALILPSPGEGAKALWERERRRGCSFLAAGLGRCT